MASEKSFHTSVVTPERAVLETEAKAVVFPAHDGELGILRGRAPLLTRLGIGVLRVDAVDGASTHLYIDGGFAQMVDNRLTILTEQAKPLDELDKATAAALLEEARAMSAGDERAYRARQDALQRASVQQRLAGR